MQNSINPFNIRPANRVNNISEYYFSKKLKEIAELNARGLDIISLGIGGPDRPPHPETIETLCTESRFDIRLITEGLQTTGCIKEFLSHIFHAFPS